MCRLEMDHACVKEMDFVNSCTELTQDFLFYLTVEVTEYLKLISKTSQNNCSVDRDSWETEIY